MSNIAEKAKTALASATKPGTMVGFNSTSIEATLAPYAAQIAKAMPNGGKPDAIIQAAVFQISTNPALKECSVQTLIGAVLHASLLGLNTALGQCHFIPRKNGMTGQIDCQFQIDYKGLITLAYRSGQVKSVFAEVVRRNDVFEFERGTTPRIKHIPALENTGETFAVYAVVEFENGGKEFVVMGKTEVEKRRMASPSQKGEAGGVWAKWGDEMWKKTALRNLLKIVPLSSQTISAIATDDRAIKLEDIKEGNVSGTIEISENSEIIEAADIKNIREGVEACSDNDELQRYWNQGASEWSSREDVKAIFNNRKNEISRND
jgi:recombination protein RecT